jgi:hypothetical protein
MRLRCRCGAPVPYAFAQLGCVECSAPGCPVCGVVLESVWYCARCAGTRLGVTNGAPYPVQAAAPRRERWRPGG